MCSVRACKGSASAFAFFCVQVLFMICAGAVNILLPTALPILFESNPTTNGSAQAPYFRNVSAGGVWVIPSRHFDIGGRAMSCQCFDPDETCCMPPDPSVAPFCISSNSSCCASTYCNAGESCCGHGCCPSDTNCIENGSGCCPKGQTCAATVTCDDAFAPACTPAYPPARGCCPSTLPYCRSYAPYGLGCFASPTLSVPTSAFSFTDGPISHSETTPQSQPSTTSATTMGSFSDTTATHTITITLVALGSGRYSVMEPSPPSATSGTSGTTVQVTGTTATSTRAISSTSTSKEATTSSPLPRLPSTTKSSTTTVTSTSTSTVSPPPSSPSPPPSTTPTIPTPDPNPNPNPKPSALCFDPRLESNIPCVPPVTDLSPPPTPSFSLLTSATPQPGSAMQRSQATRPHPFTWPFTIDTNPIGTLFNLNLHFRNLRKSLTPGPHVRRALDGADTYARSCWSWWTWERIANVVFWSLMWAGLVAGLGGLAMWITVVVVCNFGVQGDGRGGLF